MVSAFWPWFGLGSGILALSGFSRLILAPLVLSSIGSLIFALWPRCLGLGSLTLVGWPRHLVCGLLLSAFRPGLSVFGILSWALCGWFSGSDFPVLAPWP